MEPEFLSDASILGRYNLFVSLGVLGLFLTLVVLHRLLFKGWVPRSELASLVRSRLRWLSVPLLVTVPLWWASTRLSAFFSWSAELFLLSLFVFAVLALEALRVFVFGRAGRRVEGASWFLYAVPVLILFLSLLQVDLLAGAAGYAVGTILSLFLFLHLVYTYLFRWVPWKHPLSVALKSRLGPWVYLGVLVLVLRFALQYYPGLSVEESLLESLSRSLALLVVLVVSEALLVTLFDYYFPVTRKLEVPSVIRDLVRGLIYGGLFLAFVGLVMKRDLHSLLVGSAVLTVSIGFALQETLGNLFAGLALRLSQPYALGDFVQVGEVEGRVEKIDWRQTSVYTFTGDYLVLPNSVLAKEPINNFSSPSGFHARDIRVGLHYRHPPNEVIEVMRGVVSGLSGVLDQPAPEFHVLDFEDSSICYRIRYWLADYGMRFQVDSSVRIGLWYAFRRSGLEIPFPIRTLIQAPAREASGVESVLGFLSTVDFLQVVGRENLEVLAQRARFQLYAKGERVCVQGEPGECFYIIRSGSVQVEVCDSEGQSVLSFEMLSGNYFGEMALLTGEPRSATVSALVDIELLSLSKEDLREILVAHPEVESAISKVLAERQLRTDRAREEAEGGAGASAAADADVGAGRLEQLSEQLLDRIHSFFSY